MLVHNNAETQPATNGNNLTYSILVQIPPFKCQDLRGYLSTSFYYGNEVFSKGYSLLRNDQRQIILHIHC